jgi:hypothetical protein
MRCRPLTISLATSPQAARVPAATKYAPTAMRDDNTPATGNDLSDGTARFSDMPTLGCHRWRLTRSDQGIAADCDEHGLEAHSLEGGATSMPASLPDFRHPCTPWKQTVHSSVLRP